MFDTPAVPAVQRVYAYAGHRDGVYALAARGSSTEFFSGGGDGVVALWDGATGQNICALLTAPCAVYSLAYHPDSDLLWVGLSNGDLHCVAVESRQLRYSRSVRIGSLYAILPYPKPAMPGELQSVWLAGGNGTLLQLDPPTGQTMGQVRLSADKIRCLAALPQHDWLVAGSSDHSLYLLSFVTGDVAQRLAEAHQNSVFALATSPCGLWLYSAGRDLALRRWAVSPKGLALEHEVTAHNLALHGVVAFESNSGTLQLGTCAMDRHVKLWDADLRLRKVIDHARNQGHTNSANVLLWHPGLRQLLSGSDDRQILQWDVQFWG
jgi:WD40 repeat protein